MKQSWRNRSVLLILTLLGAAAPLGQIVRIVEERATDHGPARYDLVARTAAPEQQPQEESSETSSDDSAPRLLRLVTDHWDVSSPVHFSVADLPVPANALDVILAAQSRCIVAHTLPFASGPPLVPASRGPPLL